MKTERKYLIVNEDHRPVSFSKFSNRLCLNIHHQFPVRLYTKKEAKNLIKITNDAESKRGNLIECYKLLTVKL